MGAAHKIGSWIHSLIMMTRDEKKIPIIVPTDKDRLLEGKVALVTGGSSGIGYAIAKAFVESGAKVIIAGTRQAKLDDAVSRLSEIGGGQAQGCIIDVRDIASLSQKVKEAAVLFEENRIDILVNSAGLTCSNDFWATSESVYDDVMDTNTKGTFFMCQVVGKMMIEGNVKGHILNIASSSSTRPAWTPYQMSKWAVRGFTIGLADVMIKHGIVVNAIAPGPTATPMLNKSAGDSIHEPNNPSRRYAVPEEIASLAMYMVSGAGDMIVGDTVFITGGSGITTLHN